jgi:hypothetical protein
MSTEDYVCAVFLGGFTSYLRNGWSINVRAIENCIFSIRSIECNMRPILRTVRLREFEEIEISRQRCRGDFCLDFFQDSSSGEYITFLVKDT